MTAPSHTAAALIIGNELLTGKIRTVDEVTELIDGVTVEEVRRVARRLLVSDRLNLAVVGPFRSDRRFTSLLRL